MRRPGLFSLTFLAALFLSVSPRAQSLSVQDVRYEILAGAEKRVIDRIAADFYEEDLRQVQNEAIEEATAASYLAASADERARFLQERRKQWRALSPGVQLSLRGAKRPRYDNLTEEQKAPFRRHAINKLSAAGAIDETALSAALREEI